MARHRPRVKAAIKAALVEEAGNKCANPGCSAWQTNIHHIREWAVYQTHDEAHMIAVCPNCHDAVHRGSLRIKDATLYRWKAIIRSDGPRRDALWVDPGPAPKLRLGGIGVFGGKGVRVLDFDDGCRLGFRIEDGDIHLVDLAISTYKGKEVVRVSDNRVTFSAQPPVTYESVPGRRRITAPVNDDFIPLWALKQMRDPFPPLANGWGSGDAESGSSGAGSRPR